MMTLTTHATPALRQLAAAAAGADTPLGIDVFADVAGDRHAVLPGSGAC